MIRGRQVEAGVIVGVQMGGAPHEVIVEVVFHVTCVQLQMMVIGQFTSGGTGERTHTLRLLREDFFVEGW